MRVVFNSDQMPSGLSPMAKARAWAEAMEQCGVNFEARCSRTGFSASLACSMVGGVCVTSAQASSLVVERSKRKTADGDDRLHLLISHGGGDLFGQQSGREAKWSEGAAAFFSYASASITGARHGGRALSLMFPRDRLGQALPLIEDRLCQPLAANSEALVLLRNYAASVVDRDCELSGVLAEKVATHLVDLAILAIGASGTDAAQARERGLPAGRLAAVMGALAARCQEPGLTAAAIGADLGISARYIQHLLQANGTTFSDELTRLRLDLAHRRLTDPRLFGRSIADIVFDCGFNDLSTFYRAFRARYDCTPRDLRNDGEAH